jgi:hypothetical protein
MAKIKRAKSLPNLSELPEMKVGSLVRKIEFSKEENARIAKQLEVDSQPKILFLTRAKHTEQFKRIVSKIKIDGQSPGRPGHIQKALEQIIKYPVKGNNAQKNVFWNIYGESVANYIADEQQNLHKLLIEVPVSDEQLASDKLLEIICKNAKQYDVKPKVVKELYEIWGFERIDNIDELLSLCDKDDPVAHAMKQIKSLDNYDLPVISGQLIKPHSFSRSLLD